MKSYSLSPLFIAYEPSSAVYVDDYSFRVFDILVIVKIGEKVLGILYVLFYNYVLIPRRFLRRC